MQSSFPLSERHLLPDAFLVIIHYKYRNAEQRFEGTFKQPFIFDNFADAYLRRYPGGSEFPVRVSPQNLADSIPVEGRIVFTRVE
jgi:hypothetical protein